MSHYRTLLSISRPRFWIYLLGPYLIGIAAAYQGYANLPVGILVFWGFYFLWPANLLIYGVNDLSDRDTDQHNPKKGGYEHRLHSDFSSLLSLSIIKRNIPFILIGLFTLSSAQIAVLLIFVVLGVGYSLPPVRFKARPFLDALSNSFYILPGVLSYLLLPNSGIDWSLVVAGCLWATAMHAYSAVPDIAADRKAGLHTIATSLGKTQTLYVCAALYVGAGILSRSVLGIYALGSGSIYLGMMILSIRKSDIFSLYRYFPLINMTIGFGLFWYSIWVNLPTP